MHTINCLKQVHIDIRYPIPPPNMNNIKNVWKAPPWFNLWCWAVSLLVELRIIFNIKKSRNDQKKLFSKLQSLFFQTSVQIHTNCILKLWYRKNSKNAIDSIWRDCWENTQMFLSLFELGWKIVKFRRQAYKFKWIA